MNFKSKHALWEMRREKSCTLGPTLGSVKLGHTSDSVEDLDIIIDV